mgnify:CR=1 FL=1
MAALATVADVEVALGRPLTAAEKPRTEQQLIPRASSQVIGYLGCDPSDPGPTPDTVAEMVARSVQQRSSVSTIPAGTEQITRSMGPFAETYGLGAAGSASGATWMTAADKDALRPFRCNGGMRSLSLSSDQTGHYRRVVS